ncbi:MAG: hemerythrin domain-containing protein [Desulfosarcinaceae bacterium]|jgi:hemerythrin-like domain-containing protein
MNAIDELIAEHEAVRTALKILECIAERADTDKDQINLTHLEQLFDFFAVFVDRCHHGKEEELLFPALESVGVSRDGGPVGVMIREHQQGRDLVAGMKAATIRYRNGDAGALLDLIRHAEDYVTLLNYHIDKENDVLFDLARRHIPEAQLASIKTGFDRIESERIGAGRHEAFHAMLSELEQTYLQ